MMSLLVGLILAIVDCIIAGPVAGLFARAFLGIFGNSIIGMILTIGLSLLVTCVIVGGTTVAVLYKVTTWEKYR